MGGKLQETVIIATKTFKVNFLIATPQSKEVKIGEKLYELLKIKNILSVTGR